MLHLFFILLLTQQCYHRMGPPAVIIILSFSAALAALHPAYATDLAILSAFILAVHTGALFIKFRRRQHTESHIWAPRFDASTSDYPNVFAVLDLPEGSSRDQVDRAFRRLAVQLHPDRGQVTSDSAFIELMHARDAIIQNRLYRN